ncbi:VOC family protein [Glycomyces sp. YM15]|uniref:VOC family protein n=1 Tax=Glycomyces sp. YM15 TaxID=2800446 RepID=UPI0019660BDF|nr:VOC family protein [Glycomyces sp. YM15]
MTSIPIGAPVWSDALSSDLASDVPFYERLFGWASTDAGEDFGHYTTFSIPEDSGPDRPVTGVMPCPPGMEASRIWNLQFRVEDCDAATEKARRLGGAVAAEPQDVGDMLRFSMVNDPNGASFGLVETKEPGTGFGAWGEPNSVSWVEYRYDGVPAEAMKFYADLLGWNVKTPPWEAASNPKPYAALSAAGSEREFGGCHAAEGWELSLPPQWNVMVAVDDVDRVCERAVDLGGAVVGEPMDVPGLRIAGIATPTGTVVGVQSPRSWE